MANLTNNGYNQICYWASLCSTTIGGDGETCGSVITAKTNTQTTISSPGNLEIPGSAEERSTCGQRKHGKFHLKKSFSLTRRLDPVLIAVTMDMVLPDRNLGEEASGMSSGIPINHTEVTFLSCCTSDDLAIQNPDITDGNLAGTLWFPEFVSGIQWKQVYWKIILECRLLLSGPIVTASNLPTNNPTANSLPKSEMPKTPFPRNIYQNPTQANFTGKLSLVLSTPIASWASLLHKNKLGNNCQLLGKV
ncbi:hypothetical protein Bbelb_364950 [Branchiostoma belcheri]|nr:hypothetical protein Bbelb_364950 [Branchiostoma belcheri]